MSSQNPLEAEDFVHAAAVTETEDSYRLLTFPDQFRCYTHTSVAETELIYNEIFVKQEYLRHGLSFENCRYVFDVGANIGLFTVFAKSRNKDLIVYAFEPISDTYRVLLRNIALHENDAVHAYNYAIGLHSDTERMFTFYPNMAGNSTANPENKEEQRQVMNEVFGKTQTDFYFQAEMRVAPVRTLSALIAATGVTTIDFLKIDVEGDELAVLQGISPEHCRIIRQVVVEVHTALLFQEVQAFLNTKGFTVLSDTGISAFTGVTNIYAVRG